MAPALSPVYSYIAIAYSYLASLSCRYLWRIDSYTASYIAFGCICLLASEQFVYGFTVNVFFKKL